MSVAANRVNGVLNYWTIKMNQNYNVTRTKLAKCRSFCGQSSKTYLSGITNLSRSIKAVPVAPQNNPGASGQMTMKIHCSLTAAGMGGKRWWRSPAGYVSRCFSRKTLPAG